MIRISQADSITLYRFNNLVYGSILCDDLALQCISHLQESAILSLSHTLYRNASHFTHHGSNIVYFYWCAMTVAFTVLPFLSSTCQHFLHLGLLVTICCSQFIVLIRYGILLICNQYFYVMFQFQNIIRNACILKMYARANFVKNIYGLIWEETVCYISVCQFHTCFQCFVAIDNLMEFLIGALNIMKYLQSFLRRCRIDDYLLESSFQSTVFLNTLAIFVQCCCTDALYYSTSQGRFQDVGSVHGTFCASGTNERMNLIDEEDDFWVRLQFVHNSLDTLFERTTIFGASDKTCEIQADDTLIKEEWGRLVVLDELG